MDDPLQILNASQTILLVDWKGTVVPRTLLEAGFKVYGSSPAGYTRAALMADLKNAPPDDAAAIFAPEQDDESGYLVFHRLPGPPANVDIVHVYRPTAELPGIIEAQAVKLKANAVWLQPPITANDEARR